jgi:hypothetical protein
VQETRDSEEMRGRHWDDAYARGGAEAVSWFEPTPRVSLELIESLGMPRDAPVVDVGGGASTLARELVARGYTDVSVLDISEIALSGARNGLGDAAAWLREDVLRWRPERRYALWHDRAVLHFFTDDAERENYVLTLDAATAPGSFVVLGVFAPDGPDRCSGLPVSRYDAEGLQRLLGSGYALRAERSEAHVTPGGVRQPFTWAVFERRR